MKLFKKLKSKKGQSLAEFAVTTAMMATLATTAAPEVFWRWRRREGKEDVLKY